MAGFFFFAQDEKGLQVPLGISPKYMEIRAKVVKPASKIRLWRISQKIESQYSQRAITLGHLGSRYSQRATAITLGSQVSTLIKHAKM